MSVFEDSEGDFEGRELLAPWLCYVFSFNNDFAILYVYTALVSIMNRDHLMTLEIKHRI